MLKEGYMLKLPGLKTQGAIEARLGTEVGDAALERFRKAWLDNHFTKADMDQLAAWGFNSVRLPMHHQLFIAEDGPAGSTRFNQDGFARLDALLEWAEANRMWVFLDLHAAPGGQGNDIAIADRDPSKPSLWDSPDDQRRTVDFWREVARRYADNPWVGGYDIVNEPNWGFSDPAGDLNGCAETDNRPIQDLWERATRAIREHDTKHMVVVEGNCWGNNYQGMQFGWDDNLVLSFHKYWNRNDEASLATILALQEKTGLPVWLGESGENSNGWYRDAIRLVEGHGVGWAWWPHKKLRFNQPVEVVPNKDWTRVVEWLENGAAKPSASEIEMAMMTLAEHDLKLENTTLHPDVVDAMIRQPHDDTTKPFAPHRYGPSGLDIAAVDYDLGAPGFAYHDRVDGNYHVSTGGERTPWNDGMTYRNDGVDIRRTADGEPYVTAFEAGEWLRYTIHMPDGPIKPRLTIATGQSAVLSLLINGGEPVLVTVDGAGDWQDVLAPALTFMEGRNDLVVRMERGSIGLKTIRFP